jgi:hypothetical protein
MLERRLAFWPHEPQERGGLHSQVETEGRLVGLGRVVSGLCRPLLDDKADGVLDGDGCAAG